MNPESLERLVAEALDSLDNVAVAGNTVVVKPSLVVPLSTLMVVPLRGVQSGAGGIANAGRRLR